ncbi:TerD family protein [Nocardia callitridis]|uniref:DNA polymerase III n=1 Tax=Nocardia callitridis TaxID=648753 RepID=A0ABP9JTT5_9NOCA
MQPDSVVDTAGTGAGFGSFTVVDVETSGLRVGDHRVLSVAALALDSAGAVVREFHTLIDPGCDPGPVHIHGLTRELLSGAPRFEHIEAQLSPMLAGRVMVAHNAGFDYGFLAGEFTRIGAKLPVEKRLCTLALARRVAPPTSDCRLSTLAAYYGIPQQRAHDALDDTRVLAAVLRSLIADAARLGVAPPLLACPPKDERHVAAGRLWPSSPPKTWCAFKYPGRFTGDGPLTQGMKVAFTGETRIDRSELIDRAVAAGLDVTGAVSARTSVLVTNSPDSGTGKARAAHAHGTAVVNESRFLSLLAQIRPGVPRASTGAGTKKDVPQTSAPSGPLDGRRVLVLGGQHSEATEVRARITDLGGSVAVNMSRSVTDILTLAGAQKDPRVQKAIRMGIAVHGPELIGVQTVSLPEPAETSTSLVLTMSRGQVVNLPVEDLGDEWSVRVSWTQHEAYALDVVAFALDGDETVGDDSDFVFYNQPFTDGIRLNADGPSEQSIGLTLDRLPQWCRRVVVAATIDGTVTFGSVGAIEIEAAAGEESGVFARATLDAATEERTLLLAEIYLRGETWRLRAVGQGYPFGLAALARSYGVDVAGE